MILLFPWSRPLRQGGINPKNYPFWKDLVLMLENRGYDLIQVGIKGEEQLVPQFKMNLTLVELNKLVQECQTWIGIDSFPQHLCWDLKKRGIVLWGQSDPKIFGHSENVNILKDRKYLRDKQFWLWEQCEYMEEAFVTPDVVVRHLTEILQSDSK
jgi:ADP-heptose:LPS heptosyltransferase